MDLMDFEGRMMLVGEEESVSDVVTLEEGIYIS